MNDRYPHYVEEQQEQDHPVRLALASLVGLLAIVVAFVVMLIFVGAAVLLVVKVLALFGRAIGLWG